MNETWLQIQDLLEKTVQPGIFKVWIKPLKASLENQSLVLTAPNEFVASWVRDRLHVQITEASAQVLGFAPDISVHSDTACSGRAPARALSPREMGEGSREKGQMGLPLDSLSPEQNSGIVWRYHFKDFVVGPCNELAYVAAKNLCSESVSAPEQLFISSPPGLGKTHLLQAVGHRLCEESNRQCVRVAYLSAEEFCRQYVMALKSNDFERFKDRLRNNVDLLLMEDIQFFEGKEKMQDELLATLKALRNKGARIVFSSSFLPRDLKTLDSQLTSRFCSGLLTVIDKPDQETRRRILFNKASNFQISLPEDVALLLADRIKSDVRQLESCLHNLVLKARILNQAITLDMAWDILDNYASESPSLDMESIVEFICDCFDLSTEHLASKSRKRQIVLARNVAFLLARRHTDLSLQDIGRRFNRRHSTVIKAIDNLERQINLDTPLGRQVSHTLELATRKTQ